MSGYGDQSSMVEVLSDEEYEARRKAEEEEASRNNSSNTSTEGYGQNRVQVEDSPQTPQEEPTTYEKWVKPWVDKYQENVPRGVRAALNPYGTLMGAMGIDEAKAATDIIGGGVEGILRTGDTLGKPIEWASKKLGLPSLPEGAHDKTIDDLSINPTYEGLKELSQALAPTMIGGMGGTAAAGVAVKNAPRAVAYLGRLAGNLVGDSLGYAASKDPGENRILFGENSAVGLQAPFDDKTSAGQFGNDFVDALSIAAPTAGLIDIGWMAISGTTNLLIKPIWNVTKAAFKDNSEAMSRDIMEKIMSKMGAYRNAGSERERAKIASEIADVIRDNKTFLFEDETGVVDKLTLDTFSSIQQGLDPEDFLFKKLDELKRGHLASGHSTGFEQKVSEPIQTFERVSSGVEEGFGGLKSIKQAEKNIQKIAQDQVDIAEASIGTTERKILEKEGNVASLFEGDSALSGAFDNLSKTTNINIDRFKNLTIEKLRNVVRKTYDTMKSDMDSLIKAMPDDIKVDTSEIADVIDSPAIPGNIKRAFDKADGNFKQLYNDVVPKISRQIQAKLKAGDGDIEDLIVLKDFINESGPTKEFREYYSKNWAPLWRDGKLEEFADVYSSTQKRGDTVGFYNYRSKTRKVIEDAMSDEDFAQQFKDLLSRPEAKSNPKLLTDYYLGEVASRIQSHLNSGKSLADINIETLLGPLQKSNLPKLDPTATKRINGFLQKLNNRKNDIQGLKKDLEVYREMRDLTKDKVFKGTFSDFFSGETPTKGGIETFNKLFSRNGNADKISEILSQAKEIGDNETIDGLKAAWLRSVKDELLNKEAVTYGGGKAIKSSKLQSAKSGETDLFEYGDILFRDQPKILSNLKNLLDYSSKIQTSVGKGGKEVPFSITSPKNIASNSADTLITFIFGALNRVGARLRSGKGALLREFDPTKTASGIVDRIVSDPEYAESLLRDIVTRSNRGFTEANRQSLEALTVFLLKDKYTDNEIEQVYNEVQNQINPQANRETDRLLSNPRGLIEEGNIDIYNRPRVQNRDGSISTVRSMSFNEDGSEILIPTVSEDGRIMTDDEAINLYHRTGKHLGKFKTPEDATNYANRLHRQQEEYYRRRN